MRPAAWSRSVALASLALVLVWSPAPSLADGLVDVHNARTEIWSRFRPTTPEDMDRLAAAARELETTTRKPVLDEMTDWMTANGYDPPIASGTPPHTGGSTGVVTDVDHTYGSLRDAKAAAERYKAKGYTVEWNAPDTFSVKELDYTGFSAEQPAFARGSKAELAFEAQATRFSDKVWTVGGQEWVEGVKIDAEIQSLKTQRAQVAQALKSGSVQAAEAQALRSQLAELDTGIDSLKTKLKNVHISDRTGLTVDMMKKGSHHMPPAIGARRRSPSSAGRSRGKPPRPRRACLETSRTA